MHRHTHRFERCERRSLCTFPNCERYPHHGALFGPGSDRSALIFFENSPLTRHTFGSLDKQRLRKEIEDAELLLGSDITQHDRAIFHLVDANEVPTDELLEVLDIICGITLLEEREQPRLERYQDSCSGRSLYALYAFKDRKVCLGFATYHDAVFLLERTWQRGLLSDKDYGRLLGELPELDLPPGSPSLSFYRQRPGRVALSPPPSFLKRRAS